MHSDFFCLVSEAPFLPFNLAYAYGRSFFQIHNFSTLIADLVPPKKLATQTIFAFPKLQKTGKIEGKFNLPSFSMVFLDFGCVPVRILKK